MGYLFALSFFVFLVLYVPIVPAQTSPPSSQTAEKIESDPQVTIEIPPTVIPIKEEVKILRKERRRKMPYLDRGYVKSTINKKTVQARQAFIEKEIERLEEVVGRAIAVYTPAKAAKERISLAKRRILVAARELLPEGSFNFELRKGVLSRDSFSGQDYHVTFRIPVFRGGILWNTFLREKAELRAAKREYDAVLNELVDEVAKAYFEYNRAREVYGAKERLLEGARRKQGQSREKHKSALISEIEHLNVESMVGQMEYDVETAEQELELAKLELQRLLDLDVSDEVRVASVYNVEKLISQDEEVAKVDEKAKRAGLNQTLEEFVDLAYRNRPELQVEAERLRAARLEEKSRKGEFLPRVDLTLEFGELGEAFIKDADDPTHHPEWRLGLEVSQNVVGNKVKYSFDNDENAPSVAQFLQGSGSQITRRRLEVGFLDGLEEFAEWKEATIKRLEQVIELEKKEREVIREVKEAYFDYHKAEVQVESSLKRNQYRERLVQLAEIRLGKAEIEISEYLQAEIDLAEERGRLHQALADLAKAKSKLNRSIGIRDFLAVQEPYGP